MKKLTTLMLGLGLILGTTSFAFGDDTTTTKTKKMKTSKSKKSKKTADTTKTTS